MDAPHDGYTLYVQSVGTFVTRMRIDGEDSPVNAYEDFQAIGSVGNVVTGLIVPADTRTGSVPFRKYVPRVSA